MLITHNIKESANWSPTQSGQSCSSNPTGRSLSQQGSVFKSPQFETSAMLFFPFSNPNLEEESWIYVWLQISGAEGGSRPPVVCKAVPNTSSRTLFWDQRAGLEVFQMVNKIIFTNAPILWATNANNPIFCLETEIQSRFLSLWIWRLNTDTAAEQIPLKIPARRESASPIIKTLILT